MKSYKNKYTYSEAQKKVQEMGIETSKEYKERYKEDPRLILNAGRAYPGEWFQVLKPVTRCDFILQRT
ncbi:hypothetical protein C8D97_10590 [Pleionea mediterranea]|uniref:Uncharacterized protein n=1 Tax=Pleionea mediterranea TaxID=523701 RepID=A0A316FUL5_9GAMM|nr:hypothetical protein C8D97_10590 [Pleionea mediterranea]